MRFFFDWHSFHVVDGRFTVASLVGATIADAPLLAALRSRPPTPHSGHDIGPAR